MSCHRLVTRKIYQTTSFLNPAKSPLAPVYPQAGAYFFVGSILAPELNLGIKLAEKLEFDMPLDPKECRRQALACVRLAQTSTSLQVRRHYAELAKTWLRLAGDLDDMDAHLKREPEKKAG